MKVILTHDVPNVGRKNEVKTISDGYVKNFLFPRGLAVVATEAAMKKAAAEGARRAKEVAATEEAIGACIGRIAGTTIALTEKANEAGHLFAGITRERLAEALGAACGGFLPPEAISLEKPIKEIGAKEIKISHGGLMKTVIVTVSAT